MTQKIRYAIRPENVLQIQAKEAAEQVFAFLAPAVNTAHDAAKRAIGDADYETSPAILSLKALADSIHAPIESLRNFCPRNNVGILKGKLNDTAATIYALTGKAAVVADPALQSLAEQSPDFDRALTMLAKAGKDSRDALFNLSLGTGHESAAFHAMA